MDQSTIQGKCCTFPPSLSSHGGDILRTKTSIKSKREESDRYFGHLAILFCNWSTPAAHGTAEKERSRPKKRFNFPQKQLPSEPGPFCDPIGKQIKTHQFPSIPWKGFQGCGSSSHHYMTPTGLPTTKTPKNQREPCCTSHPTPNNSTLQFSG